MAKAPGAQLPDPAENAKAHEVHAEAEVSTWKVAEEDAVMQHEARAGYLVTTIISRKRVGGAAARQIPISTMRVQEILGFCKETSTLTDFRANSCMAVFMIFSQGRDGDAHSTALHAGGEAAG